MEKTIDKTNGLYLKFYIFIFIFFVFNSYSFATTYYVNGAVENDLGSGSISSPKKYIQSGLNLLNDSGGDNLIIANGTYSDEKDQITHEHLPSSKIYTIVEAETDWGVVIMHPLLVGGDHDSVNFINIKGIQFIAPYGNTTGSVFVGSHVKLQKCAFVNSSTTDYGAQLTIGNRTRAAVENLEYILIEDCIAYGQGGRYKIYTQSVRKTIFRRCVVRADGGWVASESLSSLPSAGIMVYNSEDVLVQNCIVIDSEFDIMNWKGAFYVAGKTGSSWPVPLGNVTWSGCLSVKNRGISFYIDLDSPSYNLTFENCSSLGSATTERGVAVYGDTVNVNVNNLLATGGKYGISEWGDRTVAVLDSIIENAQLYNLFGGDNFTVNYSNYWNGANNLTNKVQNSLNIDPEENGLIFPVRIEAGSILSKSGSNGGRIGPEIIKKIGVTGTIWGETGYNDITEEDLWPFPNEDNIKSLMRVNSERGFCADGKQLNGKDDITLTSYIWEYLGNQMPITIYSVPGQPTWPIN